MYNFGTVLVVEDDREIREVTSLRLRAAGYRTLAAGDGEDGIRRAITDRPDAIVMDIRMPKMDGMTALLELKADQATRSIPIVMLSASVIDRQKALDAGARFFVAKPYQATDLLATVAAAIGKKPQDWTAPT